MLKASQNNKELYSLHGKMVTFNNKIEGMIVVGDYDGTKNNIYIASNDLNGSKPVNWKSLVQSTPNLYKFANSWWLDENIRNLKLKLSNILIHKLKLIE